MATLWSHNFTILMLLNVRLKQAALLGKYCISNSAHSRKKFPTSQQTDEATLEKHVLLLCLQNNHLPHPVFISNLNATAGTWHKPLNDTQQPIITDSNQTYRQIINSHITRGTFSAKIKEKLKFCLFQQSQKKEKKVFCQSHLICSTFM